MIKHDYKAGEILELTKAAIAKAQSRIRQTETIEQFETAIADLLDDTKAAKFMRYVHHDAKIRDDAKEADKLISDFLIEVTSNEELYATLQRASAHTPVLQRLKEKTLLAFKHRGLGLSDEKKDRVKQLQQELAELERNFESNIAEANDFIEVTDIEGLPDLLVQRLQKHNGVYRISTNTSEYAPVMQYARNPQVRKLMQKAYENRAAQENSKILTKALVIRKELAVLLGHNNWVSFRTEDKMAKSQEIVHRFLDDLRLKLADRNIADLRRVEERKRRDLDEQLRPWDIAYYETLIKREELDLDEEKLREYFPATFVVQQMFAIYSALLGITIHRKPADAWAQNVEYYEVHDKSGHLISNFYTDFFPRPNKYEHAAAFTLRSGRMMDGGYLTPISAIVCNFAPPTNDTPALLSHDEVETLFHEFGHIIHQGLTTAPYAYLSGTNVPTDFVEMPSQIMEHWVWDHQILKQISSHYKSGEHLPDDFIERLIATRHFNEARTYTRQILLSLYDFTIHTQYTDPIQTWRALYKEITTLDPPDGTHWPAGFGHLMGGYDAGYYSYLWSKVYADDLFTRFRNEGLMNPQIGLQYRQLILEPGDTREQLELMREFLGRPPNSDAFFELMG